ncbi:hypothetical protein E2C01_044152 [Portunus trituberculatus]|uniref:Uncharacterized protein n=1 Tax=Portunus trituberculatus TaxID=210409 RepID=A0A5B7FXL9_PORTR|nr:hypothetical protein [Portunus trituberculatus]
MEDARVLVSEALVAGYHHMEQVGMLRQVSHGRQKPTVTCNTRRIQTLITTLLMILMIPILHVGLYDCRDQLTNIFVSDLSFLSKRF